MAGGRKAARNAARSAEPIFLNTQALQRMIPRAARGRFKKFGPRARQRAMPRVARSRIF